MAGPTATGDNYTTKEKYLLGRFKHLGLMQYRDFDGYYCIGCGVVYNVLCAKCGAKSSHNHLVPDDLFIVQRPLETRKLDNMQWTKVDCSKCDFRFLVIVQ